MDVTHRNRIVETDDEVVELIDRGETDFVIWQNDEVVAVILHDGEVVRIRE